MKLLAITRLFLVVPVVALACSNYQAFTPAGTTKFEPVSPDAEIPLLETAPTRPHEVIGYAECYAGSTAQAIPMLQKQARLHGGHALLNLTSEHRMSFAFGYRAAVIRYTEANPSP